MQDFLSLYAKMENPTFAMVLFTFLLAFLCSSAIALTYYFSTPTTLKSANYIQALILSSVIATMILQSIGDNVASGLGILGALTIINFRTSFRDPRDIIFMFAALGVGIACGSYVFQIAITGTSMFCFLALALKFTPFSLGNHAIWELRVRIKDEQSVAQIEKELNQYCRRFTLDGFRNTNVDPNIQDRDYVLVFNHDSEQSDLIAAIRKAGGEVRRLSNQNAEGTTEV
jgi:uncharacterized membrane protein YhiD involved in acid resistance